MPEFTGHRDLRTYLRVLWRWKLLFLCFVIAAPVAAYLIEKGKPKLYRSTALVGVNQTTVNTSVLSSSGSFSTTNVTAIAELVTTTPVASIAAGLLYPPANAGDIVGEVSASGDPQTNFLTINAQDRSPARAAQIANAFARAIGVNRRNAAVAEIDASIRSVQLQLARVNLKDAAARATLESQLPPLRAALATQGTDSAILQAATPSGTPVGVPLRRTIELGLVIGLLLGFGAITLAENADRRLRTPDDLEGMTDLPLMTAIPPSAFSGQLETSPEDDEAFQMLRTALMYFNADQPVTSVVVTSPGEKDGKTTVATRLAVTTARSGLNVVLVDADLRRTQVSARLGINSPGGLEAVLAGNRSLTDALVEYPVTDAAGGALSVLPAGPSPRNPSALMSSERMQEILRELESQYDLVIVDTPAALAVSDPLPLMRSVSGVMLVARMNRSSRETIARLQRMIVSSGGTLIGVVATGVSSGMGYYTPNYYKKDTSHGSRLGRWRRRRKAPEVTLEEAPAVTQSDPATDH